jgi:cytochrome oxidase assembly protein ShyY1
VQWFSFAAIALIGYVVLLRRDRRDAVAPIVAAPGEET